MVAGTRVYRSFHLALVTISGRNNNTEALVTQAGHTIEEQNPDLD